MTIGGRDRVADPVAGHAVDVLEVRPASSTAPAMARRASVSVLTPEFLENSVWPTPTMAAVRKGWSVRSVTVPLSPLPSPRHPRRPVAPPSKQSLGTVHRSEPLGHR